MKNLINAVCYHMLPLFIREQLIVKNNVLTLVTTMQYVKTLTRYKNVMPCHVRSEAYFYLQLTVINTYGTDKYRHAQSSVLQAWRSVLQTWRGSAF